MPKVFTSKTQKIGQLGEDIAIKYLKNKGFLIIDRNYTQKWGEIDIIASKKDVFHFIEVKSVSVSHETTENGVSREIKPYIRPEENMTKSKYDKFTRTVLSYVAEKRLKNMYQLDLLCVYIDTNNKIARVKTFENIVF